MSWVKGKPNFLNPSSLSLGGPRSCWPSWTHGTPSKLSCRKEPGGLSLSQLSSASESSHYDCNGLHCFGLSGKVWGVTQMEVRGTSPYFFFQGFKGKTGHPGLPGPKVRGTSGQWASLFSLGLMPGKPGSSAWV